MINQPFFQVALPLMVTILIAAFTAAWSSNKRIDEISRRLDDTNRRLDRLESTLQDVMKALISIDHRLTVLEQRSSLVRG
jgi:5-bromo-4-chloroindolyl phosphate hydrolysis protein